MNPATPVRLITAAALLASLSACYVVPIDPRTGQPVPIHPQTQTIGNANMAPAASPIVPPPAPPAPIVLQARLYPLNEQANQGGLLVAQVSDNQTGRGNITLSYRGALLQGESTRVDSSYASFGRIHNEVLGTAARSFSGRRGIANAYGSNGINAQCEYLITGPTMGTGACLFSDGAKYQMHFGG